MIFVIGLGNPGNKYKDTRHNLGQVILDFLGQKLQIASFKFHTKLKSQISKNSKVMLIKPETYMNESGQAVRAVLGFYKNSSDLATQQLSDLYVIHDDLDLEIGNYKIQLGKGPKVHNGLNSIYQHLATDQFWHVRVGIDARKGDRSTPPDKYVLGKFNPEEKEKLDSIIKSISDELLKKINSNAL
ncbi:MAG: aminoacyl-tRNA hydrolase [Patescibacteria group bacterium]